jgi:hypothetical protein
LSALPRSIRSAGISIRIYFEFTPDALRWQMNCGNLESCTE